MDKDKLLPIIIIVVIGLLIANQFHLFKFPFQVIDASRPSKLLTSGTYGTFVNPSGTGTNSQAQWYGGVDLVCPSSQPGLDEIDYCIFESSKGNGATVSAGQTVHADIGSDCCQITVTIKTYTQHYVGDGFCDNMAPFNENYANSPVDCINLKPAPSVAPSPVSQPSPIPTPQPIPTPSPIYPPVPIQDNTIFYAIGGLVVVLAILLSLRK